MKIHAAADTWGINEVILPLIQTIRSFLFEPEAVHVQDSPPDPSHLLIIYASLTTSYGNEFNYSVMTYAKMYFLMLV